MRVEVYETHRAPRPVAREQTTEPGVGGFSDEEKTRRGERQTATCGVF
jgi:hypothetical protein